MMTKKDKIKFVKSLTASVALEIISKIESGKIPENWGGVELRWLLAERFENETIPGYVSRKAKYNNDVICNNI